MIFTFGGVVPSEQVKRLSAVAQQNQVIDGRCCGLSVLARYKMAVQDHVNGVLDARCEEFISFSSKQCFTLIKGMKVTRKYTDVLLLIFHLPVLLELNTVRCFLKSRHERAPVNRSSLLLYTIIARNTQQKDSV